MADIWLIAIILIPALLILLLRVNAVFVYLGLCVGYVLSQFDGANSVVSKVAGSYKITHHFSVGANNIHLIMLLLPAVATLLFFIKTARGKLALNVLPAVAVGLLAVIVTVPVLPPNTAITVLSSPLWRDVVKYQGSIVGLSVLVVMVLFLMQRSKMSFHAKGSKHHKGK